MAIGGDQGGSIRMPAAYCGIVRHEADLGPGALHRHHADRARRIDHTGPMTATVADNALMLEVIAGPDGLDPRQMGCTTDGYTEGAGRQRRRA